MQYSFKCPAPCNYEIKVDAKDDDDASNKIMAAGKIHAKAVQTFGPAAPVTRSERIVSTTGVMG